VKENIPLYKKAAITASTAEFLVKAYGASSVEAFSKALPQSANVLDVGAGDSELGRVVAGFRPDITWTNLDIEYSPSVLSRLENGAPRNLKFMNADILDSNSLPKNSFDRVYAFWILPHLGLEDPLLVKTAMVNMLGFLKESTASELVVGPLVAKRTGQSSANYLTTTLSKKMSEKELATIANDCTFPKERAGYYRAINRAGLATFKNGERTGQKPTKLGLWDIKRSRYVKAFSIRGLFLIVRFRIFLVLEKIRNPAR